MANDVMYLVCLPCWESTKRKDAAIKFARHYGGPWRMMFDDLTYEDWFVEHVGCDTETRHHFALKSEIDVMDRLAGLDRG